MVFTVQDSQIKIYVNARDSGLTQARAASLAEISTRTGHRIEAGKHRPKQGHIRQWRTRTDPLAEIWKSDIEPILVQDPTIKPFQIFQYIQKKYPGKYTQVLRTLQRRIRQWKSTSSIAVNNLKSRIEKDPEWENRQKYFIRNQHQWEWMQKLLQGKFTYHYLAELFEKQIEKIEIKKLYNYIIKGRLSCRNRAIIIFSNFNGIPDPVIANFLMISSKSVKRYIKKYKEHGIDKLFDFSKGIIYKSVDKKYTDKVFEILHSPPSDYGINRTTWKMDDIKKLMDDCNLGISIWNIRKIIRNAGYKVRTAKKVLTSRDPNYREKLQQIQNILSNLKPKEKFFSIDEFGPFSVKIHGGKSLTPPGQLRTVPQWQKTKGKLIATAALELSRNQITHFYSDKKNTKEMIKLIKLLLKEYPDEDCLYISWDAASWHASQELYKTVEEINSTENREKNNTPILKLVPLPSGAQFLNVIESIFSGMSKAILHNSDYQSVEECMHAIDRYFDERNQHFKENPKRAGNKIWGNELVVPKFKKSNNCKDPKYR